MQEGAVGPRSPIAATLRAQYTWRGSSPHQTRVGTEMTDSAPPEDASPPDPVARPATSRWAKLWGQLKRFRGPIAAIAAFGAILSGFLGYWSAYQTVEKVVVPKPAPAVVTLVPSARVTAANVLTRCRLVLGVVSPCGS